MKVLFSMVVGFGLLVALAACGRPSRRPGARSMQPSAVYASVRPVVGPARFAALINEEIRRANKPDEKVTIRRAEEVAHTRNKPGDAAARNDREPSSH